MTLYGSQLEAGGRFSRYPWPSLAHCRDIIRYAEATTCSSWWKPVSIRGLRFVVWCCWYSVEGHIRCRGLIPLLSALTSNRYKSAFQDAESDFGTDYACQTVAKFDKFHIYLIFPFIYSIVCIFCPLFIFSFDNHFYETLYTKFFYILFQ